MDKKSAAALTAFREKLHKEYGPALSRQDTYVTNYEACSTGIYSLDYATCIGGIPRGRITQFWGPEGTAKTTTAISAMGEGQRKYPNLACGYIDMEQTFDWEWARHYGLDVSEDRFVHIYPDDSEDVSDLAKKMISTGLFSHIVVDSIGGMESRKAFEKDAADSNMGKNAQIITRMTKNLTVQARKHQTYVVLINQVRANFGSPTGGDTYSGPKNLRHALTMSIRFSRTGTSDLTVTEGGDTIPVGREFKAKVDRSKVASMGRTGTFTVINYPTSKWGAIGIDKAAQALDVAKLANIFERSGAWYTLPNGERFNGETKLLEYLRGKPEVVADLLERAMATQAGEIIPEHLVEFNAEEDE